VTAQYNTHRCTTALALSLLLISGGIFLHRLTPQLEEVTRFRVELQTVLAVLPANVHMTRLIARTRAASNINRASAPTVQHKSRLFPSRILSILRTIKSPIFYQQRNILMLAATSDPPSTDV